MKFCTWSWFAQRLLLCGKHNESLVARKQQQQQQQLRTVWECVPLFLYRHCCHAIVFGLASEQVNRPDARWRCYSQECICSEKCRCLLASKLYYVNLRTFTLNSMYIVVIPSRVRKTDMHHILQNKKRLKKKHNVPTLQTTDLCSKIKNKNRAGLIFPHKQQAPTAGNTKLHFLNH